MKKTILSLMAAVFLSSCATIFYSKPPTFQQAPIACVADILFAWWIIPLTVDALYGSCRVEGLTKGAGIAR